MLHTGTADARVDYSYTTHNEVDTVERYADAAGTSPAGTTVFNHDPVGRVTEIAHLAHTGATLADYHYAYDDAGRLTSKTEGGTTTAFTYDAAGQLTGDGSTAHTYDGAGNRTDTAYATTTGNRLQSDDTLSHFPKCSPP